MKSRCKRKIVIGISLSVAVIILVNVATILSNHFREMSPEELLLRSSIEEIKEHLLNDTPFGMNMEDVIKVIESHDEWKIWQISYEHGPDYGSGIGAKSIRAHIGEYRGSCAFGIGMTDVAVWWAFDENAELIDIFVRKDVDAI